MACKNQLKLSTVICFRIVWYPSTYAFNCSHAYALPLATITVNEPLINHLSGKCTFIMGLSIPTIFNFH
jgi:hypothetical protein